MQSGKSPRTSGDDWEGWEGWAPWESPGPLTMNNVQICQQSDSLSPNSDFGDKGVLVNTFGYVRSSRSGNLCLSVFLSVMVISCPEINHLQPPRGPQQPGLGPRGH